MKRRYLSVFLVFSFITFTLPAGPDCDAEKLCEAALDGNVSGLRSCIGDGVDVNGRCGVFQTTALINGASRGHEEIVAILLEEGADINARDITGDSPLLRAVANRNYETAVLLIESGADIHAADERGITPLIYASSQESPRLMLALLDAGVEIDQPGPEGQTALANVAAHYSIETLKTLLDAGASPHSRSYGGMTVLMHAASCGRTGNIVELVRRGVDVNARGGRDDGIQVYSDGWTALMYASVNGHIDAVRLLIRLGADVNAVIPEGRNKGYSALQFAEERELTAVIEVLKNAGAVD